MTHRETSVDDRECRPALWEAHRYLTGELTAVEAEAFEERLADDLELSEALADAVRLSAAVAAAELVATHSTSLPSRRSADRVVRPAPEAGRRVYRGVVAAVSAVALALSVWGLGLELSSSRTGDISTNAKGSGQPVAGDATGVNHDFDSLLSAWVELNQSRELPTEEFPGEPALVDASGDVPDWMFAALLSDGGRNGADGFTDDPVQVREGAL